MTSEWLKRADCALRIGLVSAPLLIACGPNAPRTPTPPIRPTIETPKPVSRNHTERAQKIVGELQNPALKTLLEESALPYLRTPSPTTLIRNNATFNLRQTRVLVATNLPAFSGDFSFRGHDFDRTKAYYPLQTKAYVIPALGMFSEAARNFLDKEAKTKDGHPLAMIEFDKNISLYSEDAPEFFVGFGTKGNMTQEQYEMHENLAYLHSMFLAALYDTWKSEVVKYMQQEGMPYKMEVKDKNGKTTEIELISQSLSIILNEDPDTKDSFRIAALMLTLKAVDNSPIKQELVRDPNFRALYEEIGHLKTGSNPQEILLKSLHWALNSATAQRLK